MSAHTHAHGSRKHMHLKQPKVGQYIVGRTLGTGTFGKVKRMCRLVI